MSKILKTMKISSNQIHLHHTRCTNHIARANLGLFNQLNLVFIYSANLEKVSKARFVFFMNTQKLKIALQKSGRLSADSIDLLKTCGIKFDNGLSKLKSAAQNFPLEIFFLRDDDIPQYIADGVADIGIVGENVLAEAGQQTEIIERLGFGKCRLSLAVPKSFVYDSIKDLDGKRIATSYPQILGDFFAAKEFSGRCSHD
jgi:ATP phosphoribosyltransferase